MATNLDSRALSNLGVNTDPTQYKAAFEGLKDSIDALQKPLSDINNSVSAITKSLTDSSNAGDIFKKKIDDIASSYNAWKTILGAVTIAIEGTEAALTGGLALITAFAPQLANWISNLAAGETQLTNVTKAAKDNQIVMDAVNKAMLEGIQNAQTPIAKLQQLYDAAEKSSSFENRKKAAIALKEEWAAQFKNYSIEEITTGKAQEAYDKLTAAITANSQARAAANNIAKNNSRKAGNDARLNNLQAELESAQAELDQAQKAMNSPRSAPTGAAIYAGDSEGQRLEANFYKARENVKKIQKEIADLTTDTNLLTSANNGMKNTTLENIDKIGLSVIDVNDKIKKSTPPKLAPNNDELAKAQAQAEQMMEQSAARKLQITMQGYGSELEQEDAHYNTQIARLKEMLNKKYITQQRYNDISKQLEVEHHAAVGSFIDKFNKEDAEKVKQLTNETAELAIKSQADGAKKQQAELNQQQKERDEQYAIILADEAKKKKAIEDQINSADPGTDLSKLKTSLANKEQIIKLYEQKQRQEAEQTKQALKKIDDQVAFDAAKKVNDKLLKDDQKTIDNAGPEAKQAAEKQLIADKYKFEIDQAKLAGKATTELEEQQQEQLDDIDEKYAKDKQAKAKKRAQDQKDFELQTAQQVSNAAFSIVKSGISSQADAKVKQLEAEKNSELSNTSLTAAQKQAIQQDYQKKEAAVKAKAFKDEQLASIGQALINGALAVTKATAQTGILSAFAIPAIIAETAVQVATIAAQKPPAYARGGVHYFSDGRGGVLPGYSRTDNTNAYLRSGEGIVVSEAMRVPWARNLVSAINVGFGGRDFSMSNPTKGYAVGGIFTDGGDANRYYNQPVHDQKNLANTIAYQMINNFPPVYVDVKDINNQQNILAQTINRVNL